jgi:protein phosphatase
VSTIKIPLLSSAPMYPRDVPSTHALPLVVAVVLSVALVATVIALVVRRRPTKPRLSALDRELPPKDVPVVRLDVFEGEDEADDDPNADSCPAIPIAVDPGALEEEPAPEEQVFDLSAVGRTDRGKKRKENEDSVLVRAAEGLCVLADGMGGHRGGAIASRLAVETIADALESRTFADKPHAKLPPCASEIVRAIQMASVRIRDASKRDPALGRMGTTVVAVRFCAEKNRLYVGHVGDSRCYRFREGALQQMTTDHTMASFGVSGDGAALLSRAVGPKKHVPTDVLVVKPRISDVYLLCSDGLTRVVPDELIRDALDIYWDLDRAAERLVDLANRRGGPDNVSVVLVRFAAHSVPGA